MHDVEYAVEELEVLYREQRMSERADLDGRVTEYEAWRRAIDRRAERIRVLERAVAGGREQR